MGDNCCFHVLLPLLVVNFEKFVLDFFVENLHVSEHSSKIFVKDSESIISGYYTKTNREHFFSSQGKVAGVEFLVFLCVMKR